MKLKVFYKADYEYMKNENSKLNGEIRQLNIDKKVLIQDNEKLKDQLEMLTFDLEKSISLRSELEFKLLEKNSELKKTQGSKGGLVKQINLLNKNLEMKENKIKELECKLEESLTDKYIVKKIRPSKPIHQKIKPIRQMKSSVQRYQQKLERMEV